MRLIDLVREQAPKFNDDVARGFVTKELDKGEEYVKLVLLAASSSLPPEIEYVGPGNISTKEQFEVLLRENRAGRMGGSRESFEYARTSVYLMKCYYRFKGELIEQYVGLPFVEQGGILYIRGSVYSASPQLADIAMSVTSSEIYVPVTRDKLKFFRSTHTIRFNGMTTIGYVIWCSLYRDSKRNTSASSKTVVMYTAVVHYLLSKYGLTETAQRMGVSPYIVGTDQEERVRLMSEGYQVFETSGHSPRGLKVKTDSTKIWFAFPAATYNDKVDRNFITSVYYVIDHFPHRMSINELDNPVRWLILLAHAIFANGEKESILLELIRNHANSIENYIDAKCREWLILDGLAHVENIYDLMIEVANSYTHRKLEAAKTSTSVYGKYLIVNRKIHEDVTSGIFKCVYKLQQLVREYGDRLSKKNVSDAMRKFMNSRIILQLNKAEHPEVEPVSCPGAYMTYKITSRVVLQSSMTGSSKAVKMTFDSFAMGTDVSIAECCTMLAPTKAEATGRGHLNFFVKVDATGRIVQKEHLKNVTIPTQQMLMQK